MKNVPDNVIKALEEQLHSTNSFLKAIPQDKIDFRYLVNAKIKEPQFEPYTQVFGLKHGFINNLCILDLLFNEGPNAVSYLESQTLKTL